MVWRYTLTEIYSRAKTYIWRKAHNLENLEENVIIITGEDNSLRSHCLKPDFIRVFALFSFCYYFILRFVLLCFVDHCLCLCLFSFGHCIVCLLAIVLSVFWPLYCLSFGHCIVCISNYCFWLPFWFFFFNFCLLEYQFELLYSAHCVRRLRKNRIKQATIFDLLVDHIVVGTKRKRHRFYNGTESIIKEEMSCVWTVFSGVRVTL